MLYIILGVIVLLVIVIPLFLPSKVHCERCITIDASASKVFEQINAFQNWVYWSPWAEKDPDMKNVYSGTNNGVGNITQWSGNKMVGTGRMEIVKSIPNSEMRFNLQYGKNPKASPAGFLLSEVNGKTSITWFIDIDFGMFLPGRYFGLFFDKMLGPDYEKGLANLKRYVEK